MPPTIFTPPAVLRLQGHDYELLGEVQPNLPGISIYRRPPGFDKTDPRDKEGVIATGDLRQAPESEGGWYYLPTLVGPPISSHPYKDAIRQTREWKELGRDDLAVKAVEALFGPPPAPVAPEAINPSAKEGSFDVTSEFPEGFTETGWTGLPGTQLPEADSQ